MFYFTCFPVDFPAKLCYTQKQKQTVLKNYLDKRSFMRMGTLKYAILGLLNRNEMTGYELSKRI